MLIYYDAICMPRLMLPLHTPRCCCLFTPRYADATPGAFILRRRFAAQRATPILMPYDARRYCCAMFFDTLFDYVFRAMLFLFRRHVIFCCCAARRDAATLR